MILLPWHLWRAGHIELNQHVNCQLLMLRCWKQCKDLTFIKVQIVMIIGSEHLQHSRSSGVFPVCRGQYLPTAVQHRSKEARKHAQCSVMLLGSERLPLWFHKSYFSTYH